MHISNGLRATLSFLGMGFIALGLFLNFQLYTSLAPDGETIYKGSYALVGLLLDLSKVSLLIVAVYFVANSKYMLSLICFAFYALLSFISFSAGWGFSLIVTEKYESAQAKGSFEYANYQNQLDTANSQKAQYAAFATLDTNAISSELNTLKEAHASAQTELSNCPANYKTHCINPAKARIAEIEANIKPLEQQLSAYSTYIAASNSASEALSNISALDSGKIANASNIHPLFEGMAVMFGTDSEMAKYRFTFTSFLLVELLGGFLYLLGLVLKPKTDYTLNEIMVMTQQVNQQRALLESAFNSAIPVNSIGEETAKKQNRLL